MGKIGTRGKRSNAFNVIIGILLFVFVSMLLLLHHSMSHHIEFDAGGYAHDRSVERGDQRHMEWDGKGGGPHRGNENGMGSEYDVQHPRHLQDEHLPGVKESVTSLKKEYARYEEIECPPTPDPDYPTHYHATDIISNWNPDSPNERPKYIYNSLCYFDYSDPAQRQAALNYRLAEVPFVVRHIPDLDNTVLRWGDISYMMKMFGESREPYKAEYSKNNHFMYWRQPHGKNKRDYKPPTEMIKMTFKEWYEKASQRQVSNDEPHWYFRASGCSKSGGCPSPDFERVFKEIPIFKPHEKPVHRRAAETEGSAL